MKYLIVICLTASAIFFTHELASLMKEAARQETKLRIQEFHDYARFHSKESAPSLEIDPSLEIPAAPQQQRENF